MLPDDQVIMAAGAFVQGSSIELSVDAPLREPYIGLLSGRSYLWTCSIRIKSLQELVNRGLIDVNKAQGENRKIILNVQRKQQ